MLKLEKYKHILNKRVFNLALKSISTSPTTKNYSTENGVTSLLQFNTLPNVLTKRQAIQISAEYSAILKLFSKSFNVPQFLLAKSLQNAVFCKEPSKPPANDPQKPPNYRSDGKQDSEEDPDKKKKDDEEKMTSVLTKTVLWMMTIYMFVALLTMVLPQKNKPETTTRYVSWNEFVHHMLAAGEVKELIAHPDMEMITIILYDGAIIKGKRVSNSYFLK